MPGDQPQLAAGRHDRGLVVPSTSSPRRAMSCAKPARAASRSCSGMATSNQSRAEDVALVAPVHAAALAVDQQHPALGVEDDDHRARDVEVALRAVALRAQHLPPPGGSRRPAGGGARGTGRAARRPWRTSPRPGRRARRCRARRTRSRPRSRRRARSGRRPRRRARRGRRAAGAACCRRRARPATQAGRRNAHTRPHSPRPGAISSRREPSAKAATCGPAAGSCHVRGAAQQPGVALRPPDGAVGPAERLAERGQDARAQLVRLEAGGDVVGDRLLGEQEPVGVVALGARRARRGELALEHGRAAARGPGRARRRARSRARRRRGRRGARRAPRR